MISPGEAELINESSPAFNITQLGDAIRELQSSSGGVSVPANEFWVRADGDALGTGGVFDTLKNAISVGIASVTPSTNNQFLIRIFLPNDTSTSGAVEIVGNFITIRGEKNGRLEADLNFSDTFVGDFGNAPVLQNLTLDNCNIDCVAGGLLIDNCDSEPTTTIKTSGTSSVLIVKGGIHAGTFDASNAPIDLNRLQCLQATLKATANNIRYRNCSMDSLGEFNSFQGTFKHILRQCHLNDTEFANLATGGIELYNCHVEDLNMAGQAADVRFRNTSFDTLAFAASFTGTVEASGVTFEARPVESTPITWLVSGNIDGDGILDIAASDTLTVKENIVDVDDTGGNRTITLRPVANYKGQVYKITKTNSSANTVTVDPDGTETINGATTKVLSAQYDTVTIYSNGTEWIEI